MAAKLGPEHEKTWSSKPLIINKALKILPSEKNSHFQQFINQLPNGYKRVSEYDESLPPFTSCLFGKPVSHTPLGKDRDSVTVDVMDPSNTDIIKVVFSGEAFINFPKPINSQIYIFGGKCVLIDGALYLECLDECKDLQVYIIDRWLYTRLSKTHPSSSTDIPNPKKTKMAATNTGITTISNSDDLPCSSTSSDHPLSTTTNNKKAKEPTTKGGGGGGGGIKTPTYTYQDLKKLVIGSRSNVAGVVTFFKSPYRSRGTDYVTSFVLVDPTQPSDGINVVAFHKDIDSLPNIRGVGDIVLLRRVEINAYNNAPQILSKFFSSFHIFDGTVTSSLVPYCSSHNATLSEVDKKTVEVLKTWKGSLRHLNPKSSLQRLESVQFGMRFNLVCHIASVVTLVPDKLYCMCVSDGTRPFENTTGISTGEEERETSPLPSSTCSYVCHIFVCVSKLHLKADQVVFLSNVVAYPIYFKDSKLKTVCVANIDLHCEEGMSTMAYYVLQESDPDVIKLRESLAQLNDSSSSMPISSVLPVNAFTLHTSVKYTSLTEVKDADVYPSKYRCFVQLVGIDAVDVIDTVCLCCVSCFQRYPIMVPPTSEETSKYCSQCNSNGSIGYMYEFVLTVQDGTGDLCVLVNGRDAESLFNGKVPPSNFHLNKTASECVMDMLKVLFNKDDPFGEEEETRNELSQIDCCIAVCKLSNGSISYRLCDTYICLGR